MSNPDAKPPLVINGWTIYAHPLFSAQLEELSTEVEALKSKDAEGYKKKNATKRLASIVRLLFEVIPADPTNPIFRQGTTLGDDYKHWFRGKFNQQYRLFFRYDTASKIIVLGWVNDENTKRAYNSRSDAYHVFKGMLEDGHPPNGWKALLKEAKKNDVDLQSVVAP